MVRCMERRRGRVLAIFPDGALVECDKKEYRCSLRGALKKKKNHNRNLLVVGDFVIFAEDSIEQICDRFSILSRQEHFGRRKQQLIAANIDQVLITMSWAKPAIKPSLIDRYLIATYKGNMEPVLVINKMDLCDDPSEVLSITKVYEAIGIPVIHTSTETGEGIEKLKEQMKNVASVFSGQSGVGKSSLINEVTGLDLTVGEIRPKTNKGAHTTSHAKLVPLDCGGWCIDTPGIRSFGVWDLQREDLKLHFTEISAYGQECRYADCTHTHEPDCAVRGAVEEGEIPIERFESYLKLLTEIAERQPGC